MGASELDISVSGTEALGRASAALREAEVELPDQIKKEVRQVAQRLALIAKRRALAEPTHGPKHTGLRAQVSAGVAVVETETGAKIITSMPQSDEAVIPRGLDDGARGWRHPVFGNRNNWVTQRGAFSWFMDSMREGASDGEQALHQVLEDAAQRIDAET